MKRILILLLLLHSAAVHATHATFTNKVWARADSTGKANGDRYTFLSDGTFVITSPHGAPSFGFWKPEGNGFVIEENGISHKAGVASLTASSLRLKVDCYGRTLDIPFALVDPAEPDTVRRWGGFHPNAFRVEARGSEPGWTFFVEGGRATMTSEFVKGLYEQGTWKYVVDRTWEFVAKSRDGTEASLTIVETPIPCTDADYHPGDYVMEARLEAGGATWNGCALLSRLVK